MCSISLSAQLSKKHFIPPLTNSEFGNANPENQFIYISTPKNNNVSYTIKQVGLTNTLNGIVSKNNPQEIYIGNGETQLFQPSNTTSTITNNKGFIIEASDVVYVSVRVMAGSNAQAGALVSKGNAALGKIFRAGMFTNENPQDNYLNFISVMATENNTNITFSDIPTNITIKNYTGTLPISINLNEGESYIIATNSFDSTINRVGLIGTLISSDKNIVANVGSTNGSFHNGGGRDYGIDQIVDISKIGDEYIFVKGDGSNNWENVLIVAHENNTSISINGNTATTTIQAGEYFLIEGNNYNSDGNMYLKTSKNVFAYQGVGANNSEANQGLFFVPPLSCENRGKVDEIPTIEAIGSTIFNGGITIVTNKGATVTINNLPLDNFTTSGPFDVTGNPNYVTYKIINLTGNTSIESSDELYCAYFNFNGAATSGSFYSGFPTAPEINFNTTVAATGNCIPNVKLEAANTDIFDSFEWFYDDGLGGGFKATGISTNTFTPSEPGNYVLRAFISCTMTEFESVIVPVSICPDDFDGDGVIDNLDIDADNDGITNCEESSGNAVLNLSTILQPVTLFKDGTSNATMITASFNQKNSSGSANTITGDSNGNFNSTLQASTDSESNYLLTFNQAVNIEIKQNDQEDHVISEGEYFVVKVSPNSKNTTLLNPGNQLLVDTNFDGIFESGITIFTASEIRFKYASNLSGTNSTFKFIASQISEVTFSHKSNALTAQSKFFGNVSLSCFSLDSDSDGVENMFDLDSDNDGIPDMIEAFGQPVSLSGTDANEDGLDDFFEAAINLDIDGDSIKNYVDIDSDNDGIFDTTEAGHNLDTDLDGIIDNANLLVGKNGLVDSLENIPDAKTLSLNYNILNTDNDLIFNFLSSDSDNDGCNDVTEAGFTDQNNDGFLDGSPFLVNTNGKVINNTNGYTLPNSNYTIAAPININTPFENVVLCENTKSNIIINSNADSFVWETSTNNGVTWQMVTNNATFSGVNSNQLIITNTSTSLNNQQFRVKLMRNGNSCTSTSNAISVKVNLAPVVTPIVTLKQCDNDLDRISTVNLTQAEISISADANNNTFEYYASEADAIAGTPQVTDKIRYLVNTNGNAWVRTISNDGCYTISKIEIEVEAAADVAYFKEFAPVCDDFLQEDGTNGALNDDTDGITNFDFSNAKQEILNFFPAALQPNLSVNFYETISNRTAAIKPINDISNYRNIGFPSNISRQTIYFKITNKNNNNCTGTGELYLKTNSVPIANAAENLTLCDDAVSGLSTDGFVDGFMLTDNDARILGSSQSPSDFEVTYHKSAEEANSGSNPLA
ncbi:IgGFc-binding protein, partial [Polaribacter tangerinus]|uniref:IgGFc-binding protein n=1 Tax=Polaribacter tangerinus TaxID=1920034 RepID=UPI001E60788A